MQDRGVYRVDGVAVDSALSTNKVLKDTYRLLAMTLLFSAMTAGASMAMNLSGGIGLILLLVAFFVLLPMVQATANSSKGLIAIFGFTGVVGASIGPLLNQYLALANGGSLVMQALGGTAIVFFGLSAYALMTRKDFSYLAGFIVVGLIVAIVAMIAGIFLQIPALNLAISSAIILLMSGLILMQTSSIINGGERNYILATVSLYMAIYNIFTSMLHILGALGGDD